MTRVFITEQLWGTRHRKPFFPEAKVFPFEEILKLKEMSNLHGEGRLRLNEENRSHRIQDPAKNKERKESFKRLVENDRAFD